MARSHWDAYLAEATALRDELAGRLDLRVGVEADFLPGTEATYRAALDRPELDYVIGSVHEVAVDGRVRNLFEPAPYAAAELAELHRAYWRAVAASAQSGLFDVLAHLDLVRMLPATPADVSDVVDGGAGAAAAARRGEPRHLPGAQPGAGGAAVIFEPTAVAGAVVVRPDAHADERGMFARTFCAREFEAAGLTRWWRRPTCRSTTGGHPARPALPAPAGGRGQAGALHPRSRVRRRRRPAARLAHLPAPRRRGARRRRAQRAVRARGLRARLPHPRGRVRGGVPGQRVLRPGVEGGLRWDDPALGIAWPGEVRVISAKDAAWAAPRIRAAGPREVYPGGPGGRGLHLIPGDGAVRAREEATTVKAVILAGGFGTRLSEETIDKPKPMVTVGGRPMLWHIMKILDANGIKEFVIALGYRGDYIKQYFLDFYAVNNDITVDLATGRRPSTRAAARLEGAPHRHGPPHQTGGRLRRLRRWVEDGTFLFTYGDGVADVDLESCSASTAATASSPPSRPCDRPRASATWRSPATRHRLLREADLGESWINGGYFLLEPARSTTSTATTTSGSAARSRRSRATASSWATATPASGRAWTRSRRRTCSRRCGERQAPGGSGTTGWRIWEPGAQLSRRGRRASASASGAAAARPPSTPGP
jgi:glucose-1-phosphate cytidylyltransferase